MMARNRNAWEKFHDCLPILLITDSH